MSTATTFPVVVALTVAACRATTYPVASRIEVLGALLGTASSGESLPGDVGAVATSAAASCVGTVVSQPLVLSAAAMSRNTRTQMISELFLRSSRGAVWFLSILRFLSCNDRLLMTLEFDKARSQFAL